MAQKSKTQRAKASAARAARKEARKQAEEAQESKPEVSAAVAVEEPKKRLFGSKKKTEEKAVQPTKVEAKSEKKAGASAKKKKKGFLREVRSEMKRVTWPTRQDVLRWSVVVVCALLFFGVTVAILDNLIITPALVLVSGLGA